jgi:hypothetical protein
VYSISTGVGVVHSINPAVKMTREGFYQSALWPDDMVAAYASERIAKEHAEALSRTTHKSFGVRRSRLDARYWEVCI